MYSITKSGIKKKLESWELIIPLKDNDGKEFSRQEIDNVLDNISLNYPGYTIVNCLGFWKNQNETFKDENYQIIIDTFPSDNDKSTQFFSDLKIELAKKLRQEKIYVTKTFNKEELLSFKEFFTEIGLESLSNNDEDNFILAEQIVTQQDFVIKRLGYETVVLQREPVKKKIIWERKICGLRLKSEIDDNFPEEAILIGADQIETLGDAIFSDKLIVLIGNYEFQKYILEKFTYRPLIEAKLGNVDNNIPFLDRNGNPITTKEFIEHFSMSVFCNYMALREENFLSKEIKINVGKDGSLQIGENAINGNYLLHCPAIIPEKDIETEIIRCIQAAIELYELNRLDPIALLQAKARNQYINNRAILRKAIKSKQAEI